MQNKIIRIAVIGPESAGKTTLAEKLAGHYQTSWIPEFSRAYVELLDRPYTKEDIIYCAQQQLQSEQKALVNANKFLFSDNELINYAVWLKDVFDEENEWIEKNILLNEYDLYLLLTPDLPFEDDPVRENPLRREYFFEWYKRELDNRGFRYVVISGMGEKRVDMAIREVERIKNPN